MHDPDTVICSKFGVTIYHQMGKLVKSKYRKWWQHPKFHFHHWNISINWFKKRLSIGQKLDDTPVIQRIDW